MHEHRPASMPVHNGNSKANVKLSSHHPENTPHLTLVYSFCAAGPFLSPLPLTYPPTDIRQSDSVEAFKFKFKNSSLYGGKEAALIVKPICDL